MENIRQSTSSAHPECLFSFFKSVQMFTPMLVPPAPEGPPVPDGSQSGEVSQSCSSSHNTTEMRCLTSKPQRVHFALCKVSVRRKEHENNMHVELKPFLIFMLNTLMNNTDSVPCAALIKFFPRLFFKDL